MDVPNRPPRYTTIPFPPYRHVPGRTPHPRRDPEGHAFGRPEAEAVFDPEAWQSSQTYRFAIDLFNHGYWWECHEALEALWLSVGRTSPTGTFLQGVIQVAAALLKQSMGASQAARGLAAAGCEKLVRPGSPTLGLNVGRLADEIRSFIGGERSDPPLLVLHGVSTVGTDQRGRDEATRSYAQRIRRSRTLLPVGPVTTASSRASK